MEERTIFHKIRDGEVPSERLYDDDDCFVIKDIHPKAKTHLLFLPKAFVASITDVTAETGHIPGMLILKAKMLAERHGIKGYKLTFHVGKGGGQEVFYLHLHFLSEEELH
jgi:histidine triad (HIT) family protein